MKLFSRIWRKEKGGLTPEMRATIYASMAGGESQRNESEQQWREQLGTNYEMMHDDALEDLLDRKSVV